MQRIMTSPRADWQTVVESQGLLFHSVDGQPYWDESAYYLFEASEVDQIEEATAQLNAMCLEAVGEILARGWLGEMDIPEEYHAFVAESWERDEHTIYGRFDLAFDGSGPPRLLEYNADTPTSLLEASVIQWSWMRDLIGDPEGTAFDQFNSIHERLIEAWGRVRRERGKRVAFAVQEDQVEDAMTVAYLRDTAIQGGMEALTMAIDQIGWHRGRGVFTDLRERPLDLVFKLYPWEWMLREAFGPCLPHGGTRWLEPPWKMVLSNKAILPILDEMFPDSPYLLSAGFEPIDGDFVIKPFFSREGANVTIVRDGQAVVATDGDYGGGRVIYQEYAPLAEFQGRHAVVGSWMVNGHACGMGIREDSGPITTNISRFVPHLFRTDKSAKPPAFGAKNKPTMGMPPRQSPLWDDLIDGP